MKVKKQREALRSSAGAVQPISHMRIVLLGSRDAGKSSSGNTILGREEFGTSGRTAECVKRGGETAGRRITAVEAPGWWKNYTVEQTPERDKREIVLSVSLCPPGPHALLLTIRVDTPFTETHRRAVQEHLELLGERVWSHTIVLFTCGDWLGDTTIEQHIESGGEALQWVVEKCGNRYHVVNNKKSDGGQVTELLEKMEEMVAGNKGSLFQTNSSLDFFLNFREHTPDDHSGGSSTHGSTERVSKRKRCYEMLTMATSTQSSGYGTGEREDETGSGEMGTVIQRTCTHGGGEITQQDLTLRPAHEETSPTGIQTHLRISAFVDASTVTVNYEDHIGQGSYGAVYRGSYQGTPAAVKVLPIGDSSVITNEFLIPLRLSHPNIVRVMAVAKSATQILIANEYIHGANLQQVLHKVTPIKLQHEEKLFVALDISMAVEYIHGKAIIHQDLKPANIMISAADRKAYLTDWGMANLKGTVSMTGGTSQTGTFCGPLGGTPPYMARECLVMCKKCSPMSDMWSLGVTLLEMFTDSQAWSYGNPQEIRQLLYKRQPPHALAKLQPEVKDIVNPLLVYKAKSRMNAKDLVVLLKSKLDLTKRYGFKW